MHCVPGKKLVDCLAGIYAEGVGESSPRMAASAFPRSFRPHVDCREVLGYLSGRIRVVRP
ncbi:MAG: hypothetical protein KatS3mg076_2065 [Candidatus Binatia bacterium]|nr:MAG: hypothetical protein KatS3mg076_2065 [Candidatus Binatia bacterium]